MRSQKRCEGIESRCIALNGQEVGDCCCGFHFVGEFFGCRDCCYNMLRLVSLFYVCRGGFILCNAEWLQSMCIVCCRFACYAQCVRMCAHSLLQLNRVVDS